MRENLTRTLIQASRRLQLSRERGTVMTTYRVDCHTPDNSDQDRRLQGLGGILPSRWYFGIDTIIHMIDQGHVFYVMEGGQVVLVVVATHPVSRRRYLRTQSDSYPHNNLLNLPHCR